MDTSSSNERSKSRLSEEATEQELEFVGWLRRHGAAFGSVDWPSSETESGIRGAVATLNIDSGVSQSSMENCSIDRRSSAYSVCAHYQPPERGRLIQFEVSREPGNKEYERV